MNSIKAGAGYQFPVTGPLSPPSVFTGQTAGFTDVYILPVGQRLAHEAGEYSFV